jgi:hypothetical protein
MVDREAERERDRLVRALTKRYGPPIVEDGFGVRRLDWPCPNCDSHPASPFSVYPIGYGRDIARCSRCGEGVRT